MMNEISIEPYDGDDKALSRLIRSVGWNTRQLKGQLEAIHRLAEDKNGIVLVAKDSNELLGYISAELYEWNRLGQIQGLIVSPKLRRRGTGKRLVEQVERFMKKKKARGLHLDTPVNNETGRRFYTALGYKEDCFRTEYYDKEADAVIYLKIFN